MPSSQSHPRGRGDGHGHVTVVASRRARRIIAGFLVPALLVTLWGVWALWPGGEGRPVLESTAPGAAVVDVLVTATDVETEIGTQVEARGGDGETVLVYIPAEYVDHVREGDRLRVVSLGPDLGGGGPTHVFMDFVRTPPMLALALVMALLVVLVARLRGLAALVGLGLSLAGLAVFTLPALLVGRPALATALVSASAIMFVVLYLAHGFSARTSTALLGTLAGVVLTAGIAAWATGTARLTGLSGEFSLDLLHLAPQMSLSGVLLCGFVLAGLGVLNDVTITQASAVWELRASAPLASRREVFSRGMRIGRDHIASTVYTVAFAYVGAALPLVLLVSMSDRPLLHSLTAGELAEEIVRTLVGSIGLVLAIPATTAIAAAVAGPGSVVGLGPGSDVGSDPGSDADADAGVPASPEPPPSRSPRQGSN